MKTAKHRIGLDRALLEPRAVSGAERAMESGFWRSRGARPSARIFVLRPDPRAVLPRKG